MERKKLLIASIIGLGVILTVGAVIVRKQSSGVFGSSQPLEITAYPATIGTAASPVTLTTSTPESNRSVVKNTRGLPNMVFSGTYTPANYGSQLFLFVERSLDAGSTWMPYSTITPESGDVLVNLKTTSTPYASVTSRASGTPFIVGGMNTLVAAMPVPFSFDLSMAAGHVRIGAMEGTTGTAPTALGTLNLQTYFTSN